MPAKGEIVWRGQKRSSGEMFMFYCPGCKSCHSFNISGDEPVWVFNGDLSCPTFAPSLLVNPSNPDSRCHLFIRNGQIQYLNDSHHALNNQTVDMVDWADV